jgi:hypothetical protein
MNKILYGITKYFLRVLQKNNVDVSEIVPETDSVKVLNTHTTKMFIKHAYMSLLRLDIMRMQNDFIRSTKEPLMGYLKSLENVEERGYFIKDFEEQLYVINQKYDEHKNAVLAFDEAAKTLSEFKKTKKQKK